MIFGQKQQPVWIPPKHNPEWKKKIVSEFNIHPVTAQVLVSRGFSTLEEIHNYLYATLPNLYDPGLFEDMNKAVYRIMKALKSHETILIYGDNDVDGMTATALLVEFFQLIGVKVFYYIPDSSSHKKSIISDALQYAKVQDKEIVLEAVKEDGYDLQYVDKRVFEVD